MMTQMNLIGDSQIQRTINLSRNFLSSKNGYVILTFSVFYHENGVTKLPKIVVKLTGHTFSKLTAKVFTVN